MGFKIIATLGIGSIFFAWIILYILTSTEPAPVEVTTNTVATTPDDIVPAQSITRLNGDVVSAAPILDHTDTISMGEGLYKNTAADSYSILYDEPSGNVTVLLFEEPLSLTRDLAERQLKNIFDTKEDSVICELDVRVFVNENVNREFAIGDLGLSVCAGSTVLP